MQDPFFCFFLLFLSSYSPQQVVEERRRQSCGALRLMQPDLSAPGWAGDRAAEGEDWPGCAAGGHRRARFPAGPFPVRQRRARLPGESLPAQAELACTSSAPEEPTSLKAVSPEFHGREVLPARCRLSCTDSCQAADISASHVCFLTRSGGLA